MADNQGGERNKYWILFLVLLDHILHIGFARSHTTHMIVGIWNFAVDTWGHLQFWGEKTSHICLKILYNVLFCFADLQWYTELPN